MTAVCVRFLGRGSALPESPLWNAVAVPHSDTLVFIPAWNEAKALPELLEEAQRDLPGAQVLVIDEGSTDDTAAVARAGGAEVVSFEENRGLRGSGSPRATGRP